MLELEPTRPRADEVVHISTRRCSLADLTSPPSVRVRSVRRGSSFPPRSSRPREAGHRRIEPLATAARAGRNGAGTNPTEKTNTNGYPYPSCVPIVDSEEPKSWTGPFSFENREH